MEEVPFYLLENLAGLVFLTVGVRLLRLSRRTGEAPERRLGLHYVCSGLSYLLYEFPSVVGFDSVWNAFAGRVVFAIGVIPLLYFAHGVFRRDSAWAPGLSWGIVLMLFAGIAFSAMGGDLEGFTPSSIWFWFEWVGYTAPFSWICAESILAYTAAKRRVLLGLCAPTVVNRFLLLAGFGAAETVGSFALIVLYREYAATQVWPAWGDHLVGACPAVAAGLIWLVFFPPAFYRRWLQREVSAATATEG